MLNFNFLEKDLGIVFPPHFVHGFQEKCFSYHVLLTDQILLPDCLYFTRYWSIRVLQLFVNQVVMSQVLTLTLSIKSSHFSIWPKSHDKNLNILRTKKAF